MLKINKIETPLLQQIRRGQIYHIRDCSLGLSSPVGSEMWSNRPAIVVSNNLINKHSNTVSVVYLTTMSKETYRPRPSHITVTSNNKKVAAICDQIYTVDKSRLSELIEEIQIETLKEIDIALSITYDITPNKVSSDIIHGFFTKWSNFIQENDINYATENEILYESIKNLVEDNEATLTQKKIRHNLEKRLVKEEKNSQKLELLLDKNKSELEKIKKDNADLYKKYIMLQNNQNIISNNNDSIINTNRLLNHDIKSLTNDNKIAQNKIKSLYDVFEVSNTKIEELNKTIFQLKEKIQELEIENLKLKIEK